MTLTSLSAAKSFSSPTAYLQQGVHCHTAAEPQAIFVRLSQLPHWLPVAHLRYVLPFGFEKLLVCLNKRQVTGWRGVVVPPK
jgi:hypothetical protein